MYDDDNTNFTSFFVNVDIGSPVNENNTFNNSEYLDKCSPILITIDNTAFINWTSMVVPTEEDNYNTTLPSCKFYNTTTQEFSGEGCYVLTRNEYQTVCACLHLTYFGVSREDFSVEANSIDLTHFKDFTFKQFIKNPVGLICAACVIFTAFILLFTVPDIDDKPLSAHKEAIKKAYIKDKEKFIAYRVHYQS